MALFYSIWNSVVCDRKPQETHIRSSFRTTKKQRSALKQLRSGLAELGYDPYPVAKEYRRHPRDFLAVPKGGTNIGDPSEFLRIHPRRDGAISIQPFVPLSSFTWQQKQIEVIMLDCEIIWLDWILALPHGGRDYWYEYLPRRYRRPYRERMRPKKLAA